MARCFTRFKPVELLAALCFSVAAAKAQTTPGKLTFALPEHAGRMTLEQGSWQITELSAKSNGNEWGERLEQANQHLLAFLFAAPDKAPLTAATCRDGVLESEHAAAAVVNRTTIRSSSGTAIAIAILVAPTDGRMSLRAFAASGDLCADLTFSAVGVKPGDEAAYRQTMELAKQTVLTLAFDPNAKPTFTDAFAYAEVELRNHQYAGAAVAYRIALRRVNQSSDPQKLRRVVTDQLSMALGLSGDLSGSRAVNEAAIKEDPGYPLYYYDLACADAEEGNAKAAQERLQQAYDRRTHLISGEPFPDPTADDSLQKLRGDPAFWDLAQRISGQLASAKK